MKGPGFVESIVVAAIGSMLASVAYHMLGLVLPVEMALRMMVVVVGFGYVAWLLLRPRARSGRTFVFVSWVAGTFATVLLDPPLVFHAAAQLGMFWLARAVCHPRGVLQAIADIGLCIVSLSVAVWAAMETGSVFVSVWSALLVQSLFTLLPSALSRRGVADDEGSKRFEQAERAARSALRRLSSTT